MHHLLYVLVDWGPVNDALLHGCSFRFRDEVGGKALTDVLELVINTDMLRGRIARIRTS